MEKKNIINHKALFLIFAFGICLWFMPWHAGLEQKSWNLLVIFLTTIIAVIFNPAPMSILSMIAVTACILTHTMSVRDTLQGFGEDIVWLVVFAFFISRAIIKSNLSKRIAYFLISKLGSSTIGLSYSLILTELLIAPVIPSATARGGAIIFPIARAIADQYSTEAKNVSNPELIKQFLMKICFQSNVITSAMFLTAMVGNPFIAKLAHGIGVELDWITWAKAAFIPGLLSLILLPFVMMYIIKPHIDSCDEAVEAAKHALKEMGKISKGEIVVLCTFVLLLMLWIFGYNIGINSTATALLGCVILVLCGVITLDDIIQEKGAWDTFIWFGIFVTLSSALSGSGVMERISEYAETIVYGFNPYIAAACIVVVFFYMHYFFASITVYATVMYTTFAILLIHLGIYPIAACLILAFLANVSACLTHYGITSAPIFFNGSGMSVRKWLSIGLLSSIINISIWVASAAFLWSKLGIKILQ
ncbi:DASS family sodium-coupled anion symporter [Candidatus Lariskella endosymbiont of Epinotia ramella]|uniref:DASS family sodium-coupled anion symporter n=1 Tax=Candidatus Lariskella endosymbiont of Epinotia ramella TaxID=3066224 RepID=UPI0030CD0322